MFVKKTSPKKYGDYFLAFEADGDEEPQTQDVRNNMKQINLRPNNRARIDFRDGADDPSPEETQTPETPETQATTPEGEEPVDTTGNEDFTQDTPAEDQAQQGEDQEAPQDEAPAEEPGAETEPAVTDEENPEGEQSEDQPDTTGGDENFADGSDQEQPAEGEQPPSEDQPQEQKPGPGLEYDSTRKYKLFLDFKELHSSVENYISNLEMEIRDDSQIMETIKTSIDRLKKTRDLLFDYMTLKFTSSTYIQNLLFYQKMYAVVVMIVDILSNTLETNKNNN